MPLIVLWRRQLLKCQSITNYQHVEYFVETGVSAIVFVSAKGMAVKHFLTINTNVVNLVRADENPVTFMTSVSCVADWHRLCNLE